MAEGANISFGKIELLTNANYNLWSIKMSALIKSKHLYEDVLQKEEPKIIPGNEVSERKWQEWTYKNDEVMGMLILTLSNEQLLACRGINNAKTLWETLKKRHEGIHKHRLISLKAKLARIEKQENETIDDFLTRATGLSCEINELGTKIEEQELVHYIIDGLPKSYSEVTTALYANSDINFESMRDCLLRYEKKCVRSFVNKDAMAYKAKEFQKIHCFVCGKRGHTAKKLLA